MKTDTIADFVVKIESKILWTCDDVNARQELSGLFCKS